MEINDRCLTLEGRSYEEIGQILMEASLGRDGTGLRAVLTEDEEGVFEATFGLAIGKALCELLADAIRAAGGNPQGFKYTYRDRVFATTSIWAPD